jgi:hypothetical protein
MGSFRKWVYMELKELQTKLQEVFGEHFFQVAFYCDNRQQNNIGKFWAKLETDINGEYKAWQVRDVESFEDGFNKLVLKVHEYNALQQKR